MVVLEELEHAKARGARCRWAPGAVAGDSNLEISSPPFGDLDGISDDGYGWTWNRFIFILDYVGLSDLFVDEISDFCWAMVSNYGYE